MTYHPKNVADFGTDHGYDLTSAAHRAELAREYVRSGKAPAGMAASTIEWHLEAFTAGRRVGLYEPDGTTRAVPEDGIPDVLRDKGKSNGRCFAPKCNNPARWYPIMKPWRDMGMYYCAECCDALSDQL